MLVEHGLEPNQRNLRLAAGLAHEDLRIGLEQSQHQPEPDRYLERYRNSRLSLLGLTLPTDKSLGILLSASTLTDIGFHQHQ
jgi:hypothetical protein